MSSSVFSVINTNMNKIENYEYKTKNGNILPKNLSLSLLNAPHSGDTIKFVSNDIWYEYKLTDKILSEYYLVSDEKGNR